MNNLIDKSTIRKTLAENLDKIMLERKITNDFLAEKTESSINHISNLRTGVKNTSAYTLLNLSKALGISLDELLSPLSATSNNLASLSTAELLALIKTCAEILTSRQ